MKYTVYITWGKETRVVTSCTEVEFERLKKRYKEANVIKEPQAKDNEGKL